MRKFTLIELLIVIVIIAILLSLLLPSLGRAKYKSRKIVCASGIKQIGLAINLYAKDSKQNLPTSPVPTLFEAKPYKTRNAFHSTSPGEIQNLALLVEHNYMPTAELYYCPEQKNNLKFIYEYNKTSSGEWGINPADYYTRVSYNLLLEQMTRSQRANVKLQHLTNEMALLMDDATTKNIAHDKYGDKGWNVMTPDMAIEFINNKDAWDFAQVNNLGKNWANTTTIVDMILER